MACSMLVSYVTTPPLCFLSFMYALNSKNLTQFSSSYFLCRLTKVTTIVVISSLTKIHKYYHYLHDIQQYYYSNFCTAGLYDHVTILAVSLASILAILLCSMLLVSS